MKRRKRRLGDLALSLGTGLAAALVLLIVVVILGDVVKLKKPHPCGVNEWEIVRVGADIGLRCRGCDRKVMLVRSEFDRRFRGFIERAGSK